MNQLIKVILTSVFIIAGIFLYDFVANDSKDFEAGDLGLGFATSTHEVFADSLQLNQTHGNYKDIFPAYNSFKEQGFKVAMFTGNSQLHAINYFSPGDNLAVYYFNEAAKKNQLNVRAVQLSSPNINFQELLIYYLSLRESGIKPDWFVIGCTYRAFQLSSLRPQFTEHLSKLDLRSLNLQEPVRDIFSEQLMSYRKDETEVPVENNLQAKAENSINDFLEDHWEAYRYRGNVRSRLKVLPGILYRQYVQKNNFYSGSETTVSGNLQFLRQIIDLCEKDSVQVLIYQPPHPQSEEPFQYSRNDYEQCYKDLEKMAASFSHVHFRSFEETIPLEYWGLDNSGRLDIFHFKDKGHRLLANEWVNFFQDKQTLQ